MLFPGAAYAANSMAFTVTPPLFQVVVAPGQEWSSEIKVVNSNPFELPVYANVMNFEASGDVGHGSFIPIVDDDPEFSGRTLGDWIRVTDDATIIAQGQSSRIPFTVAVPEDAQPGGHYAAILLGNVPMNTEGTAMKVSSYVSALIFVTVEGEVVESGRVREFSTEKSFYETPEATFTLRFENTGNVHIQPQGHVIIENMWGKERGRIPINEKSEYGNVLPQSIRKYEFDWMGETNFFEVGRYKAIVTVAYGAEDRQSDYWTTYFWVIPVRPALYIFGSFFLFAFFVVWSIRRYIRRAVEMERRFMGARQETPATQEQEHARKRPEMKTLARPLVMGAVDLRQSVSAQPKKRSSQKRMTLGRFAKKYRLFLLFILVLIVAGIAGSMYFGEVLVDERTYEYEIVQDT
jgi:hypothetical protein